MEGLRPFNARLLRGVPEAEQVEVYLRAVRAYGVLARICPPLWRRKHGRGLAFAGQLLTCVGAPERALPLFTAAEATQRRGLTRRRTRGRLEDLARTLEGHADARAELPDPEAELTLRQETVVLWHELAGIDPEEYLGHWGWAAWRLARLHHQAGALEPMRRMAEVVLAAEGAMPAPGDLLLRTAGLLHLLEFVHLEGGGDRAWQSGLAERCVQVARAAGNAELLRAAEELAAQIRGD